MVSINTWMPVVLRLVAVFLSAKFSGLTLFKWLFSLVPAGGVLGVKALIIAGVLVLSFVCLRALASWANKYYEYGYKGLAVYKSLFGGLPSGKAYALYIAVSALTGGLWGAIGASLMAIASRFL